MTINVIEIQVPGTPGAIGIDWKDAGWISGTTYNPRDGVYDNTAAGSFRCILTHVAASINRPGVGASWQTYWIPIAYNGGVNAADVPLISHQGSDYNPATFRTNLSLFSTAGGSVSGDITRDGAAGTSRLYQSRTLTVKRWEWGASNVAEAGANAGSNWILNAYADAGTLIGTALTVARATLAATFGGKVTTVASIAGAAGFNLPQGVAPSAPVNGDMWSTNVALFYRIAGVTYTSMTLEGAQTVTGTITFNTTPVLPANGIALAKIAQGTALSVLGVTGNAVANYADMVAGTDGHVLRRSGTALGFGQIVGASIANSVLTWAHLAAAAIATASNYWTLTTQKILTTDTVAAAMVEQTLTEAVLVSGVDLGLGIDWTVTLTANRVMGAWLNVPVGRRGRIRVVQGGAGSFTITKNAVHKTAGGVAILLSTAVGAVDYIDYDCRASNDIRLSVTRGWA